MGRARYGAGPERRLAELGHVTPYGVANLVSLAEGVFEDGRAHRRRQWAVMAGVLARHWYTANLDIATRITAMEGRGVSMVS